MATTFTSFVTALANLTVTGVTRKYTVGSTPPGSVPTSDMPAQYIDASGGISGKVLTIGGSRTKQLRATLVILIGPVAQDMPAANYSSLLTLADALESALEGAQETLVGDDAEHPTWEIACGQNDDYWLLRAVVTAQVYVD